MIKLLTLTFIFCLSLHLRAQTHEHENKPSFKLDGFLKDIRSDHIVNKYLSEGKTVIWRIHHGGEIVYSSLLSRKQDNYPKGAVIADLEVTGNIDSGGRVVGFGGGITTHSQWDPNFEVDPDLESDYPERPKLEAITITVAGIKTTDTERPSAELLKNRYVEPIDCVVKDVPTDLSKNIDPIIEALEPTKPKPAPQFLAKPIYLAYCEPKFQNEKLAKAELARMAAFAKSHPGQKVYVYGNKLKPIKFADGSTMVCDNTTAMMDKRAELFASYLVKLGVPRSRIKKVLGLSAKKNVVK